MPFSDWMTCGVEDELVVVGKDRAEDARPEQDAGDDLHHHQRRVVVGLRPRARSDRAR